MAISLSDAIIQQKKQTIADKLATQTEDLQKQPWWKTIGKIAIPLLATMAMGPAGAALSSLGGGAGILGTIGSGLTATGGAGGILKTLGQTGIKSLFNIGASGLGGGILEKFDKRSAKDIKLAGPSETLHGREARDKLRKQYKDAKKAEKDTSKTGSILSAIMQQGGPGAFLEAGKVGLFAPTAATPTVGGMMEGLAGADVGQAQQLIDTNQLLGKQPSEWQQIMSGNKMITDPSLMSSVDPTISASVDPAVSHQLFSKQLQPPMSNVNFGQNLIQDAPSRLSNNLSSQQGYINDPSAWGGVPYQNYPEGSTSFLQQILADLYSGKSLQGGRHGRR